VGVDEVWCGGVSAWWVVLRIGGPLVVMDGSGSCAGVISAMGGYEVELCVGGGGSRGACVLMVCGVCGVWRVCAAEWIWCVCVGVVMMGGGGRGGGMMTMVAVACLSCGGGGSVSDGEQGCEDDGFRV
jgi:hypothetical protein